MAKTQIPAIIKKHRSEILSDWVKEQRSITRAESVMQTGELQEQCETFLDLLVTALESGSVDDIETAAWKEVRELLTAVSKSRGEQGFSPSETATFIFSFKNPLFMRLRSEFGNSAQKLADETWAATLLLDKLGLFTTEAYQKTREQVIRRQQNELLELSTPVVTLWKGILALPLIGTLDSSRTQVVMESLLQKIVETGADVAIIDITGVPTVDTLVAQHLLKTVTAARLMGAECIVSGIRPQIAQTIVHLGIDLGEIITKASLADAFAVALQRRNLTVAKATR